MKYLGFIFIALGVFVLVTMVASDIQVILAMVMILGGLNLVKSCGCPTDKDLRSEDEK